MSEYPVQSPVGQGGGEAMKINVPELNFQAIKGELGTVNDKLIESGILNKPPGVNEKDMNIIGREVLSDAAAFGDRIVKGQNEERKTALTSNGSLDQAAKQVVAGSEVDMAKGLATPNSPVTAVVTNKFQESGVGSASVGHV